jgi:hypothetical protein
MTEVSRQFSLREIIGTVAPGAMVLSSVLYVAAKTPALRELSSVGSGWSALLVGFVVAYGIGTLLTSLTQTVFETVTKAGSAAALIDNTDLVLPDQSPKERMLQVTDRVVKRTVSYLSGGQDITSSIRQFRESWHLRAVDEGIVSPHAFAMAATHYRSLFETEPAGEESLLFCEFYIRERMPVVMQEIEQDAAKASLMGNLIIPMLFWVVAVGAGILLSLFNRPQLIGTLVQLVLFAVLLVVFPYVVRMIGRQWVEASRHYVRILVITFSIACRLSSMPDTVKAHVGSLARV